MTHFKLKNILYNIFHYVTMNREEAIGIKIILFQLLGISFTCLTSKGKDIKSGRHLFNIEIGFQLSPKSFVKKLFPKKEYVHFCDMCGPFVKGYSELWEKGASGPFKIEFFQYHEGLKVKVDEINIFNHETNKPVLVFDFCGLCNGLIKNKFLTKDEVMKIMREYKSHLV